MEEKGEADGGDMDGCLIGTGDANRAPSEWQQPGYGMTCSGHRASRGGGMCAVRESLRGGE